MQFSIARLLLITFFVNFVVAATFVFPPLIGVSILTIVALFVVPPFIIVGVVNTRGLKQSFFLGAMISGTGHFVVNVYVAMMLILTYEDGGFSATDIFETGFRYLNGFGFLLGTFGGISGMATYYFLNLGHQREVRQPRNEKKPGDQSPRPEIYSESELVTGQEDPLLPR